MNSDSWYIKLHYQFQQYSCSIRMIYCLGMISPGQISYAQQTREYWANTNDKIDIFRRIFQNYDIETNKVLCLLFWWNCTRNRTPITVVLWRVWFYFGNNEEYALLEVLASWLLRFLNIIKNYNRYRVWVFYRYIFKSLMKFARRKWTNLLRCRCCNLQSRIFCKSKSKDLR